MSRVLKDALENLNAENSTSKKILTSILPKNSELKAKFNISSFQSTEFSINNQFHKFIPNQRLWGQFFIHNINW